MVTTLGIVYVAAVTVLFFFWAYGIYAFVRDLRRSYIPKARQYLRGRRRLKRQDDGGEDELDEEERHLL